MSETRKRILMADDHGLIAEGVRELLQPEYEILDLVSDGAALLEAALKERPDVILTDLSMPEVDGLEAARRLRRELPETPVIILTMHDDAGHVKAAFEAGVAGYLVKSSAPRELFEAIEEVLSGRRYVTSVIAGRVLGALADPESQARDSQSPLTPREGEISILVAEGLENSEIGERLFIAEVTVRTHYQNILRKLGLRNRVGLTRYVLDQGWLD